jgi:hypothetical protein
MYVNLVKQYSYAVDPPLPVEKERSTESVTRSNGAGTTQRAPAALPACSNCVTPKCQPFREPAPASTLSRPTDNASSVAKCGSLRYTPSPCAVSGRRSSVVGRRQMLNNPTSTIIDSEQAASRGLLPMKKR